MGALLRSELGVFKLLLPALALDTVKKLGSTFKGFLPKSFTLLAPL